MGDPKAATLNHSFPTAAQIEGLPSTCPSLNPTANPQSVCSDTPELTRPCIIRAELHTSVWEGAPRISGEGFLTPPSLPREINSLTLCQGSLVSTHSCSDDSNGWYAQGRILQRDSLLSTPLDVATLRVSSRWSTPATNLYLRF